MFGVGCWVFRVTELAYELGCARFRAGNTSIDRLSGEPTPKIRDAMASERSPCAPVAMLLRSLSVAVWLQYGGSLVAA
jgi:hypothetical protein